MVPVIALAIWDRLSKIWPFSRRRPKHIGGGRFCAVPKTALHAFARIYAGWAMSQDAEPCVRLASSRPRDRLCEGDPDSVALQGCASGEPPCSEVSRSSKA